MLYPFVVSFKFVDALIVWPTGKSACRTHSALPVGIMGVQLLLQSAAADG